MSNHSSGFDPEMAQMMSDTFKNYGHSEWSKRGFIAPILF